jgi:ribosomal protein S12 methylthiotransferase accessory factor
MTGLQRDVARLAVASKELVDDHVGIIRYVSESPIEPGSPKFFHYHAEACDTRPFWNQRNFSRTGGASSVRYLAIAKAIGEAVERYCSACYDVEELPLISFSKAPFQCVPPNSFALYNLDQYTAQNFPYTPFDEHCLARWTPSEDLATGQRWYVPASMVYLPYQYSAENNEFPIVQPISTGLACHSSFTEASISAICEVIERDAFTLAWQAGIALPQITIESISDSNRDLANRFQHAGYTVTLLNVTSGLGIPTVLSVCKGTHENLPALVVAASTDLNPERAMRKSLEELAHTLHLARHLKRHRPPFVPSDDFSNVIHQDDHILLYCNHSYSHLADFLFNSNRYIDFSSLPDLSSESPSTDLGTLLHMVSVTQHQVLVSDLSTTDIAELGLTVVRAIIPGFHPLFMGHRYRALGGPRLRKALKGAFICTPHSPFYDNPAPHPYP